MKKKLKWIIPLCVCLLIAVLALALFLRYRSAGETLLNSIYSATNGTYLLRAREVGTQQIQLANGQASHVTFSPNGRYVAFTQWGKQGFEALFYDTHHPRRTALKLDFIVTTLQPLDDGSLVYISNDCLYRADKKQTTLLAEDIYYFGALSGDGSAVYCFRKVAENRLDLCRVRLSDGSLTTLLENVERSTLQVVQDEAGQDIVICAQMHTYEFTAYDLVLDTLEEADAASTDEDAQARNALRNELRKKSLSETGYTVYRIVGEKQELLAEGVREHFSCDPLTGMVVHRLCRPLEPKANLLHVQGPAFPRDTTLYCTYGGTRTALADLRGGLPIEPQFSGDGSLAILKDSVLYLWQTENGVLQGPEEIEVLRDFCLLRREDGTTGLYYKTFSGRLICRDAEGEHLLSEGVMSAHLPCRLLPDGTKQLIGDRIYVIKYASYHGLRRDKLPPVTMHSFAPPPADTTLFLVQDGIETVIANISNNTLRPLAALTDGSLLADSGPLYIIGPNRTDQLSMRFQTTSHAICALTELVTLQ